MCPVLFKIYGPVAINMYGLMIALGLLLFLFGLLRNKRRKKLLDNDQLIELFSISVIIGIAGGRILFALENSAYYLENPLQFFALWDGGFSVIGTLVSVIACIVIFAQKRSLNLWRLLDCITIYAPLAQAFGRFGCFFAGCCFGTATDVAWAISYTSDCAYAPLNVALHPTQLYSAICLLLLFVALQLFANKLYEKPGVLSMLYLMGASAIRFSVDFWRGDRYMIGFLPLSLHQIAAACIFVLALSLFVYFSSRSRAQS